MPIGPMGKSVGFVFHTAVQTALQNVPVITCGDASCLNCSSLLPITEDFAHYAKNAIQGWTANHPNGGNEFCWSQYYSDNHSNLELITDQPGRIYKILCLIKVSACPNLKITNQKGRHVSHFRIGFDVSQNKMAQLLLLPNADGSGYML